jgi:hypothetical protein
MMNVSPGSATKYWSRNPIRKEWWGNNAIHDYINYYNPQGNKKN